MNYLEFYPGDYLRDTAALTLAEHGAYLKLLMTYYSKEQPLPAEYARLNTICVALSASEKAAVRRVADEFFPIGNDGLRHNDRVEADIAKALSRIESARENGKKGGRPPKANANPGVTQEKPTGFQSGSNPHNPDVTLEKAHQTPHAIKTSGISESAQGKPVARSPGADAAIALIKLGVRCTAHDPRLLDALAAGVTVQHLTDLVAIHPGKPIAYLCTAARGQLAEAGATATNGATSREAPRRLSAVERVEANIARDREARAAAGPGDILEGTATRVPN